ncbi:berberine bridge enzyme-like 17 [Quercus suber]|uniref:Berberine bridge enzyme-like 17 n=1 Tax=Quercus suber TaxID=58331 RepID=A0AAW0M1A4_QUESU
MFGVHHVDWEPMEGNKEGANANLIELMSLSYLVALQIQIPNIKVLPKDLAFGFDNCITVTIFNFFPVSWATSNSVQDKFIKCLDKASLSQPIPAEIYTPNNSSFATGLQSYKRNRRFDTPTTPKPAVVMTVAHESNVQATVVCAKKVGIELRIRSGGHDYEGVSYVSQVPFVILDMSNLRSIEIDIENGTTWFQAGAILGEIYYAIAKKSKYHAFTAGLCLGLGAGGHISGGGYGKLLRKYGVTTDQVIDAQIVDAKGRILIRKTMGENLFWALRGGGASSFGVILSWKVKLVQVPATVTVLKVNRTLEQGATDIVAQWTQVVDKLSKEVFLRMLATIVNGSHAGEKTIRAQFIGMFLGGAKELVALMNKRLPKLGFQQSDAIEMSWIESVVFWAGKPLGTPIEVLLERATMPGIFLKRKSDYVKEPISNTGLEAIWKTMIELEDNPREAFLNYRDLDIGTSSNGNYEDAKVYGIKYFKGNFHRLVRVKTNIDTDNFFRNEQSIPTLPS